MSSYILVFIILLYCLPVYANDAIYYSKYKKIVPYNGILQGSISASKELPDDFYGTWSVSSKIIETNNPALFAEKSVDIWTLQKNGDIITLANPVSGATASITVKEVQGNTATFTRKVDRGTYKREETPSITVDGENFFGTDQIIIEHYKKGRFVGTSFGKYEVVGSKLSGPTLKDIFAQ